MSYLDSELYRESCKVIAALAAERDAARAFADSLAEEYRVGRNRFAANWDELRGENTALRAEVADLKEMATIRGEMLKGADRDIASFSAEVAELKVIKARFKEVNDARLENTELALTLEGDNAELLAAVKQLHGAIASFLRVAEGQEEQVDGWIDGCGLRAALAAGAKWVKP